MNRRIDIKKSREVIEKIGFPVDAVKLVFDSVVQAEKNTKPSNQFDGDRLTNARQICSAVADLAKARWGVAAPAVLNHIGIKNSENIGQIVFGLIKSGLLKKEGNEEFSDFFNILEFIPPYSIYCKKCGYDLRGAMEQFVCPECGFQFDLNRSATYSATPLVINKATIYYKWLLWVVLVILLFLIAGILSMPWILLWFR